MLYSALTPNAKRRMFRAALEAPTPLVLPGAFNGLSAKILQDRGAEGIYLSGHMIAADLGLPDLGLTTVTEVAVRSHQIARVVDLPVIVDADTGFGEPLNAARSVQALEEAGLAGCHIEDQVNPKRCGHSEGVDVVESAVAVQRIRAAVAARRDPDFTIIARTDSRAVHTLEHALDRARAFVDAGADVVFPEALKSEAEYEAFRAAVDVPLMINLNEFGRGTPPTLERVRDLGYAVAVYPMTLMRLAMGAVERGYEQIRSSGTQQALLPQMQTKERLYELLGYDDYTAFDDGVFISDR